MSLLQEKGRETRCDGITEGAEKTSNRGSGTTRRQTQGVKE